MVNFYINRINEGRMMIEDVPSKWRKAVADALNR